MKRIKRVTKNIVRLLSSVYKITPANIWVTLLSSFISVIKRMAVIIMPTILLNTIIKGRDFIYIVGVVILYAVIITVADMTEKSFRLQLTALGYGLSNKAALLVGQKGMKIDFKNWESGKSLNDAYKAVTSSWIFMGICDVLFDNLFTALFSLAVISYIVLQANIFVWMVILLLVAIGIYAEKKHASVIHSMESEKSLESRRNQYSRNIFFDIKYGKEIRLYHAGQFFCQKLEDSEQKILQIEKQKSLADAKQRIFNQLLSFAESVIVYAFAIHRYAQGLLSIGYFLSFFAAIREFSVALSTLLQVWTDLVEIDDYCDDFERFMKIEDTTSRKGKKFSVPEDFEIQFVNVSFQYPESDHYVLKNVNLTIKSTEKIALVGENGSGKTTLVKLLLRLYDVTSGEILLNEINIKEYDFDSYIKLFAPVFQDYQLHAFSVHENIAFSDSGQEERIWELLEENHLSEIIKNTPKGLDTYTTKLLDEEGRDFSGGEKQRLAMVRAQYKNAAVYVLDEPTSAIDPIAEMEYYERINKHIIENTVVYVSHRMASTKFADHIYVLKEGAIIEHGTFPELMEKNGIYAELFHLQASYYIKKGDRESE